MPAEALVGSKRDELMERAKREVADELQKVTEQASAERAEEEQAGSRYFHCLERAAQALALSSNESADIVAQASFSACRAERGALFRVHREHDDEWSERSMQAMDDVFIQRILFSVVAARAEPRVAPVPAPQPKPQKTPI
ncbi:hypothetical protein [Bradyrhizobium oligotrophicum]|uniref:hypothetical protein n=1 Tax=Bradyrhizobium oligotrophicum TaxID=44255 RepID=UPI003EBED7C8